MADLVRIGGGVQSDVYKARYKNMGGKIVAVKVIKRARLDYFKGQLEDLRIRASLGQHENIVKLVGACTKNVRNCEWFRLLTFQNAQKTQFKM